MFSTSIWPLLACICSALLADPLQAVNDQSLQSDLGDFRLPSHPSSTLSTFNTTSLSVNASASNEISVKCDGEAYGFKPDVDDCTSALERQLFGREQIKFGERGSVSSEKFFHLPYRLMGAKRDFGGEALCYLQPVLRNGVMFGTASASQIREAASELLLKCASRAEQGGIATNFGGDKNLALILGTYTPNVECRGTFASGDSCRNIMTEMPASAEPLLFGPEQDPAVQILVPHVIESNDKQCYGRIWYVEKQSDTASWYQIWEAITAVWSVCIRLRQKGIIRGLGDHGNLFLTLTPQTHSLGNVSLGATTYVGQDQGISDA